MDDYEEDVEIDPLGIVEFPNIKKNVDIISQCSLPQINTYHQKLNPRNRRNTVFFQSKGKNTDGLLGSPPQTTLGSFIPTTNGNLEPPSQSSSTNHENISKEEPIKNEKFHKKKEKIPNSNSTDSLFTYSEPLNHNDQKNNSISNNQNNSSNSTEKKVNLNNENNDSLLSPTKQPKSYNIQVPQFDFNKLLDPKVRVNNDQLVGILSSLNAQITKEKMDLDDFLNEAEMHMNSINEITDKLYSHKFYDANFLREEAIRNVIFQQIALKRCNTLQICSRYNIQLIDNFMSFLNDISKKSFKLLVPDVDLDTFLTNYLMNYDDPKLELTKLDRRLSCIVSQIEYLKTQSLPPDNSTQMKHSQSYSKKNNQSHKMHQVDILKANSNSIQSTSLLKNSSDSIQSASISPSNLTQSVTFFNPNSSSDSLQQISLSSKSSNFDNLEITTHKVKFNYEFVSIDDGLGRMHMFKPYGKSDFVSSFLSPERKSGRIIQRFLSRITEMTYSDLDMIITAVLPHPSYYIKVRSLLFDLAWQRMDFPFAAITHLQFPDILDFTPRSLSPMYLADEYLDTPFNRLNNTYFRRAKKNKQRKVTKDTNFVEDNKSMDDINNNIQKKDFLSSSNETMSASRQSLDSSSAENNNKNISESSETITTEEATISSENLVTSIESSEKVQSSTEKFKVESSEKVVSSFESFSTDTSDRIESSEKFVSIENDDDFEVSLWPFAFTKDYYFIMMCCTNPFTIANRFCEMIQIVANVLQSLAAENDRENGNENEEDIEIGFDNIFPVLLITVYAFGCPGILDALEYCGQFVDFTSDPQQKFAMTHCNGIVEQIRRTRTEDFRRRAMKNKNQPIFAVHK